MKSALAATLLLLSAAALAETGSCRATANGARIQVNFSGSLIGGGEGNVLLNGREISRFERGEARLNLLNQTMSGRNGYGDVVRARVTNLARNQGIVDQLTIPSADLNLRNIPVTCHLN